MKTKKIFLIKFCCLFLFSISQTNEISELLDKLKIQKEDSTMVIMLNKIASAYRENDNQKAVEYGKQAYELAVKINYVKGAWYGANNIGSSIKFLGKTEEAIQWNQKALDIAEKNNMEIEKGHSYNNLALMLKFTGNNKGARYYYEKSLEAYKKTNYKRGYYSSYNNMGNLFYDEANYYGAYHNYIEGYKNAEERKDTARIAQSLNNIGNVTYNLRRKDSAFLCYGKAYFLAKQHASKREIVNSGTNFANMFFERKQFDKAEKLFLEMLSIVREINDQHEITHVLTFLSKLYFESGKYKLAYLYNDSTAKIDQKLLNQENIKSLNSLTALYENEKKEMQISNLNKENEIKEEKLKRQNVFKIVYAIGFIAIGVFAIFLIYSLREKEKARKIMDTQKKLVEAKQREVLDSIHYAKRIQNALITSENYIHKNLNRLSKKL